MEIDKKGSGEKDYEIRPFAHENLNELSLLAQELNAHLETASSFCCTKAEDIRRDFAEAAEYGFACHVDGRAVGLIGCFLDGEKKNADCSLMLGLFGDAYQEAASALLSAARKKLGAGIACTFFFPKENKECGRFLTQAGAKRQVNEYILLLQRENWKRLGTPQTEPRPVQDCEKEAFAALHDAVFPDVYCSGKDILGDLGTSRFVYVVPDAAGLAAYGVLKTFGGKKATVEIVGVREDARRHGYGRAVLNHLAKQAFTQFGAQSLDLVVDADNENALTLYFDTGFTVAQENNCYILQ